MMKSLLTVTALSLIVPRLTPLPENLGYRGIWYSNQPTNDEYVYKYSGGLGTYCAKHIPMAIYAAQVNKTFFVYGGASKPSGAGPLLAMIGYFDHATGMLSRPVPVCEKQTNDAHHNPTLAIYDKGFIWVFVSSHGGKDGFIYRSRRPYSIDGFDCMAQREFTYPQPWYCPGKGFLFLFTKYSAGRELYMSTSADGDEWTQDKKLVGFGGHYQVSWRFGDRIGTAFDWHPPVGGLNARTNLYYTETSDFGRTWRSASGRVLDIPLKATDNPALVKNYKEEGFLVYVKDLNFDRYGKPVILYLLSRGWQPGPQHGQRLWMTARWTGTEWDIRRITESDHNYDTGSLYIEGDGSWYVIAPTDPGLQPFCTGGEMVVWVSRDEGQTWNKERVLTANSQYNHTHARRPLDAKPDFYSFWADGNPLKPSESRLYFLNRCTNTVYVMPAEMTSNSQVPTPLACPQAP